MQTRAVGNSKMAISPVGFGTGEMAQLDTGWARTGEEQAVAAIHRALELGVNWIAAALGEWNTEWIIAPAVERWPGAKPYVLTRCIKATSTREGLYVRVPFDADGIRGACEESLRRLRRDAIDLYSIDLPPDLSPEWAAHAWWSMAQLQHEGKVRWIGVGDCTVAQLRIAQEIAPVTAVWSPWLPLDQEAGREIVPHCAAAGIGVIGTLPRFGELPQGGPRFEAGTRLTMARKLGLRGALWTVNGRHEVEPGLSRILAADDEFRRIGGRDGRSADAVAAAWAARLPGLTAFSVGAVSAAQVDDWLGDGAFRLADEELARIDAAWRGPPSRPGGRS